MHRLWYDLQVSGDVRAAFRKDVIEIDKSLEAMIWRIASRYAELGGTRPASSPAALYALFDGLFQSALLRHLANDAKAIPISSTKSGACCRRFAEEER